MNKLTKIFLRKLYFIELEVSLLTLPLTILFLGCGAIAGIVMYVIFLSPSRLSLIPWNIFYVFSSYFFVFPLYLVVVICNVMDINYSKKLSIYKKFTYTIITIPIIINTFFAIFLGFKFAILNLFCAFFILFCCTFKWYSWLVKKVNDFRVKHNNKISYSLILMICLLSNLIILCYIFIFLNNDGKDPFFPDMLRNLIVGLSEK